MCLIWCKIRPITFDTRHNLYAEPSPPNSVPIQTESSPYSDNPMCFTDSQLEDMSSLAQTLYSHLKIGINVIVTRKFNMEFENLTIQLKDLGKLMNKRSQLLRVDNYIMRLMKLKRSISNHTGLLFPTRISFKDGKLLLELPSVGRDLDSFIFYDPEVLLKDSGKVTVLMHWARCLYSVIVGVKKLHEQNAGAGCIEPMHIFYRHKQPVNGTGALWLRNI